MTDEAAWPFAQHVCGTVYAELLDASADAVLVAVTGRRGLWMHGKRSVRS
jgi:hypothetical protein